MRAGPTAKGSRHRDLLVPGRDAIWISSPADILNIRMQDKGLKQHSAQYDLYNRLHSISADAAFVKAIAADFPELPVVPNQRCGSWYCDPSSSSNIYAYFKSTDGHTNNWDFNLRRSNLSLAEYAQEHKGIILVDSTRRGKRMPDALSKTVPIWCAVINTAIKLQRGVDWNTELYLPASIVSPSERSQIESRILGWAQTLQNSSLPLPDLSKPLHPFFIYPSSFIPSISPDSPFTPIVCISASRWVGTDEIPCVTRLEGRTVGFEYVQGGGDDEESWGRGLKVDMWWEEREKLLGVGKEELVGVVDGIVAESGRRQKRGPEQRMLVGIPNPQSRLGLEIGTPATPVDGWTREPTLILRIVYGKLNKDHSTILELPQSSTQQAIIVIPDPKTDGKAYTKTLHDLKRFISSHTAETILLQPGSALDMLQAISIIATGTGTLDPPPSLSSVDFIAARKLILPIALLVLCLEGDRMIDKGVIASHLHRVVTLWPDSNPPRAALKRINEAFMSDRG